VAHNLKSISQPTIDGIKSEWYKQVDAIGDEGAYLYSATDRTVDWCEKVMKTKETSLLEVCRTNSTVPSALIEVSDARKSKDPALKLLTIYLAPRLILDCKESVSQSELQEISDIYTDSIIFSLKMAHGNGVSKLKIYGRTAEMQSLFDVLVFNADPESTGITVKRQGKWLIIDKR